MTYEKTLLNASRVLWVGLVCAFLLLPVIVIIPMSFTAGRYLEFPPSSMSTRWYEHFLSDPAWIASFWTSVEVAALTTAIALALGIPAAFAIVRSELPFKRLWVGLCTVPIAFPVVVTAVSLYYVLAPIHLVGSRFGLAIGHSILALPVVVLPTIATLRRFDHRLEWQARNLGASKTRTFLTVTLPMLRPTLLTVTLFAFITSFDEIIFALFLSGGSTVTLPKRTWEGLRFEIEPTVAVVATMLTVFSLIVAMIAMVLLRRTGNSV